MAPKTSVVSRSPRSLILPPASLGWSASSFSLFWPDMYGGRFQISPRELLRFLTNKRRAQETGLEKEAPAGEVPSWPMTSTGRCVARMLDAWGLSTGTPRKYQLIYGTRLINCPLQWVGLCRGRALAPSERCSWDSKVGRRAEVREGPVGIHRPGRGAGE